MKECCAYLVALHSLVPRRKGSLVNTYTGVVNIALVCSKCATTAIVKGCEPHTEVIAVHMVHTSTRNKWDYGFYLKCQFVLGTMKLHKSSFVAIVQRTFYLSEMLLWKGRLAALLSCLSTTKLLYRIYITLTRNHTPLGTAKLQFWAYICSW